MLHSLLKQKNIERWGEGQVDKIPNQAHVEERNERK